MTDVSIIIVNYNLTENIRNLLLSIEKNVTDVSYEVIIVDNNSPDRSIENLASDFPNFHFEFLSNNNGFGSGNNAGFKLAKGKYFLLLNPDTLLINNLPLALFNFTEKNERFGIIGPMLIYPDGNFQTSTAKFPNIKQEFVNAIGLLKYGVRLINWTKIKVFPKEYFDVDFVFGSCMFIKRDIIDLIGGFDEDYFLFSEEADLCHRVRKSTEYKVVFWKGGKVVHLKSQATGKDELRRLRLNYESKYKFFIKHYSVLYTKTLCLLISTHYYFKYLITLIRRNSEKRTKYLETYLDIIKKCPFSGKSQFNIDNE
jgi:GT2 family glycosyltransferase